MFDVFAVKLCLTFQKVGDILKLGNFAKAVAALLLHHGEVLLVDNGGSPGQELVHLIRQSSLKCTSNTRLAQLVGDLIIYKGPRGVLLRGVLDPGDWLAVLVVERDLGDHLPSSPGWWSVDICQVFGLVCTPCQTILGESCQVPVPASS